MNSAADRRVRFDGYVRTYLERDLFARRVTRRCDPSARSHSPFSLTR